MSIGIATGGMFNSCCGTRVVGGGAPPYRREDEHVTPFVLVKNVEIKTIKFDIYENIKVRLLNNGGNE